MLTVNETRVKRALYKNYEPVYNQFTRELKSCADTSVWTDFKESPVAVSLARHGQFEMLRFLFETGLCDAPETTQTSDYNILHSCLYYNVHPRTFLMCNEYNRGYLYKASSTRPAPIDTMTNAYATGLLNERAWRTHRILFLIEKRGGNKTVRSGLQITDIHRHIVSFM
jgi:hypothetical protein